MTSAAATTKDEPASRIGRYALVRSLGSGGMGEVYKARIYAAAGVEKDVCVKRIRRERLERRNAVERFIEEARMSMTLTHGNIVQVFDFGRAEDEYYLAMEWVDGADLGRVLERARRDHDPLAPVVSVHVAACIGRALAYAHSPPQGGRAIIHCDLKPANVLVSRSGEVKLADFGAAATLGADIGGGTKGYMAPEQKPGSVADAGFDLFALGVLLVEMLSGDRPPHDASAMEAVPTDLRALVATLLDPDPATRAHDARAVADALEAWVSRARASGGVVPATDLARRATASAALGDVVLRKSLDTDASFQRDGIDPRSFRERMTATTGSIAPPPMIATPLPERPSKRPIAIGVLLVVALGASLAAVIGGTRLASRPASGRVDAPRARPSRSEPSDAPVLVRTAPAIVSSSTVDASVPSPPSHSAMPTRSAESAAPQRQTPASLDVHAVPWASVSIDGRPAGDSPLFGIAITPGRHTLVLANPELGVRRTMRVYLSPGEHQRVVVRLEEAPTSPTSSPP